MGRKIGIAAAVVIVGVAGFALYLFDALTSFEVVAVTDDVHMISGMGGNVGARPFSSTQPTSVHF